MILNLQKLQHLTKSPFRAPGVSELRRDGSVFFIGGELPPQETLETVFDSHCHAPADLMVVVFGELATFHRGEEIVRLLKRNFHIHVMGRFLFSPPAYILERAYAAGTDLVDIPLTVFDSGLAEERGIGKEERLAALKAALEVYPEWSVCSTLGVGEEPCCSTISGIDSLLKLHVVPIPVISPRADLYPRDEIEQVFIHLAGGFKRTRVSAKPLLPIILLSTPLSPARPAGMFRGLIDKFQERKLIAASDLRRSLRVKQVEASFESAAL